MITEKELLWLLDSVLTDPYAGLPNLEEPFDSPIEAIFYWELQKHLLRSATINRQVKCETPCKTYFLDFLVESGGRKVGFECDGRRFHDLGKDSNRDKEIVEFSHVDRIYRIRGSDIYYRIFDVLDLIRRRDYTLFSSRGHEVIEARSNWDSGRMREDHLAIDVLFPYADCRVYLRTNYDDDEDLARFLMRPTIVFWTGGKPSDNIKPKEL